MFSRNVISLTTVSKTRGIVPLLLPGIREAHSFKNATAARSPFWSKLLPSDKLRKNAEKKNLPAVAVLKLQGVIAEQVAIFNTFFLCSTAYVGFYQGTLRG
jgi:hypothetical protein